MENFKKCNNDYKQTEVGIIPNDWQVKNLGNLGKFSKGKGILKEQVKKEGFPCIRYGEIYTTHNYIIKEFKSFIDEETTKQSQEIKRGDILFAGSGETIEEIGKSVAFVGKEKAFAGGDIIILSPNEDVNSECLSYILETDVVRKQKRQLGQGNAVVHIYPNSLATIKLPLPPLAEQKKIADILLYWGKSIEITERLITARERLKKTLAQRLLSSKQRFPEFQAQKWRQTYIGEVAREVSAKNTKGNQLTVLSCTKYKGLVDSLSYFGKRIFSQNLSTYKIVKRGQFAYATNHIEEGSIGYQDLYDEALISPMYTVFQTNCEVDDSFLFKLLKTETYRHIFEAMTSGSINRRGSLRWKQFAQIKVKLPSIAEQKKIAAVLNAFDVEISILENKLNALRQQKRGLMQKLLTGKIRVNVEEQNSRDAAATN